MNKFIPVPGHPKYLMNREGKFKSARCPNKFMSIRKEIEWYATIRFVVSKNRRVTKSVHRLMALAFIPNPNNYPMVNHKDGDKHNYALDNLEWCTGDHNMKHAQRTGLLVKGTQVHTNILDEGQVKTIIQCLKDGMKQKPLAKYFGVHPTTIGKILSGSNWKHIQR